MHSVGKTCPDLSNFFLCWMCLSHFSALSPRDPSCLFAACLRLFFSTCPRSPFCLSHLTLTPCSYFPLPSKAVPAAPFSPHGRDKQGLCLGGRGRGAVQLGARRAAPQDSAQVSRARSAQLRWVLWCLSWRSGGDPGGDKSHSPCTSGWRRLMRRWAGL